MPKGVPLTPEAAARRRREILDAATHLFVEKGFRETSMREIAKAANTGTSTLYDYFQTKDEILLFAYEQSGREMNERATAIASLPLPPDERLKQIMQANLDIMLAESGLYLRLAPLYQFLTTEQLTRMVPQRRMYQDLIRDLILEGIEEGRFRQVDALLAARMLVNSLVTVLFTTRPTGTMAEMMDEVVGIFLCGISA